MTIVLLTLMFLFALGKVLCVIAHMLFIRVKPFRLHPAFACWFFCTSSVASTCCIRCVVLSCCLRLCLAFFLLPFAGVVCPLRYHDCIAFHDGVPFFLLLDGAAHKCRWCSPTVSAMTIVMCSFDVSFCVLKCYVEFVVYI